MTQAADSAAEGDPLKDEARSLSERGGDSAAKQVIKFIPAEVVTIYATANALLAGTSPSAALLWVIFAAALGLAPLFAWWLYEKVEKAPATAQIVVAPIAFVVWAFALGGPFAAIEGYDPLFGAILLVFFTPTAPILVYAIDWLITKRSRRRHATPVA